MVRPAASPAASVDLFFELSLLGLVSSGYLAVVGSGYLDLPTTLLAGAGLLLKTLMVCGVLRLELSSRVVTALSIAYVGFYPLDYAFISREFVPATVHLVFYLAVMKVLTAHNNRDFAFVAVIAFMELLAASILSVNINFFVFLALFLLFGVATFASFEIRRAIRRPRKVARGGLRRLHLRLAAITIVIAVGILSLTGGLFFLLPRTARAAFRHLVSERYYLPGFSNEVLLGQIGEVQKSSTAVMHVRIVSPNDPGPLKWRGIALSQFDGRRWYNPYYAGRPLRITGPLLYLADDAQRRRKGARIHYEIRLDPVTSDALFLAGIPEVVQINWPLILRTAADGYRIGYGGFEPVRYAAYSFLDDGRPPADWSPDPLSSDAREAYLRLPRLDPRIPRLARSIAAGLDSPGAQAGALETYLRTRYGYTTELLSHEVADPLAHFLFERKKGHCEYFASAMAVMLRALGIPARVTNGFQGGVLNPVSGWYIIRASDAHSWVEAFLPGRGWTAFDPTPSDVSSRGPSLWARLGFYFDAAETFWQEWVLSYDQDRQAVLAARMEDSGRSVGTRWLDVARSALSRWSAAAGAWVKQYGLRALGLGLVGALALLLGARSAAWWKARQRVRRAQLGCASTADATLLYARLLALLRRRGWEKPASLTPFEFARSLPDPEIAGLAGLFTAAYNELRFGGRTDAAPRMGTLLKQLEQWP